MTLIKILAIVFIVFAASRAYLRFKDKSLNVAGLFLWIIIWFAALILVFYPRISDIAASFLGLRRGTDTMFFVAIILLFYLVFRLYVKIDKLDNALTSFNTNISKKQHKNDIKNKNNFY
jgi:small membrane protein